MNIIKVTEYPSMSVTMKAEKKHDTGNNLLNKIAKICERLDAQELTEAAARENVLDSTAADFWWNKY